MTITVWLSEGKCINHKSFIFTYIFWDENIYKVIKSLIKLSDQIDPQTKSLFHNENTQLPTLWTRFLHMSFNITFLFLENLFYPITLGPRPSSDYLFIEYAMQTHCSVSRHEHYCLTLHWISLLSGCYELKCNISGHIWTNVQVNSNRHILITSGSGLFKWFFFLATTKGKNGKRHNWRNNIHLTSGLCSFWHGHSMVGIDVEGF